LLHIQHKSDRNKNRMYHHTKLQGLHCMVLALDQLFMLPPF